MIDKIIFKNYKSFKDRQELDLRPITVLIGKNSSGKSSITKLTSLIESSLKGESEAPLKWTGYDNGVELGAEFEDLIYGRSRTGKLEIEIRNKEEKLEIVVSTDKETPKIFSWKFNDIEKLGFEHKFKGFRLDEEDSALNIDKFTLNTDYIGPFRLNPPRELSEVNLTSKVEKIGCDGAEAYTVLLRDALTTLHPLLNKVSSWFKVNFEGWGVQVNKDKAPFYQVEIFREYTGISINLKDVGQGMGQTLPLVVKALMDSDEEELIPIEQPELHLHPAAHGNIAELFAQSLEGNLKSYLIETHSQNFVLRLRRLIAEKKYGWFTPESLAIYYVDFDEKLEASSIRKINVDAFGKVDYWPENVFNETLIETMALREAQNNITEDAG